MDGRADRPVKICSHEIFQGAQLVLIDRCRGIENYKFLFLRCKSVKLLAQLVLIDRCRGIEN
jgi:hypothetical protein